MCNCFPINLIQNSRLKKVESGHVRKYTSLTNAKRVMVLADNGEYGMAESLAFIAGELSKRGVEFHAICVDRRTKSQKEIIKPIPDIDGVILLRKRDINWFGLPNEDLISPVLSKDHDILIDLTSSRPIFTFQYIIKRSRSTTIIGVRKGKESEYDLIIHTPSDIIPKNEKEISPEKMKTIAVQRAKSIINYLTTIQ